MPDVSQQYQMFSEENKTAKGYYVYGWVCAGWGGIYFYVGKGMGNRYKETNNRGQAFKAILEHWECFSVILQDGLTEEQAWEVEDKIKTKFIFEHGYPIMDGEGNSSSLKNRAIKRGKAIAKQSPDFGEGRPMIQIPDFEKFHKKQKDGEMTVAECCAELGISRATWYNRAKGVA